MQKITFQDTEIVKEPYVEINGVEYPVESEYQGGTDLDAETFNQMQDNIEQAIDEKTIELDDEVSTTSTNGVENQAITNYINNLHNGTILYENSNGTNADFTLSDSIGNYKYIQLEYTDNNKDCYRMSNLLPTDHCFDNLDIWGGYVDGGTWHFVGRTSFITFTDIYASFVSSRCGLMDLTPNTQNTSTGSYIYITKVIGYK